MKTILKIPVRFFVVLTVIWLSSSFSVLAQSSLKKWETFDFAKQKITVANLSRLELEDLRNLRGIVFGKHGRVFKENSIQEFLEKRAWYKPNPNFKNAELNAIERANLDIIRQAEAEMHDYVQPGDLRFWQKKLIPDDRLYAATSAEWRVMIAEVEAIHGKTFPEEPWLQKYFEERYWYKSNPNYSPASISAIERQNIEALSKKRDEGRKVAVSPGDMDKFQNVLLDEKMLEGATLNELRIMRNEFWARRGKKFVTPGYRSFFEFQEWYRPAKNQKTIQLSEIEKQNMAIIQSVENRLHEKITTEPITLEMLAGLFTEDLRFLRNEIYARHGKIYKTKDLNDYFSEQAWYKPDPNFSDSMITSVEWKNLKTIKEAEEAAVSKFIEVEG